MRSSSSYAKSETLVAESGKRSSGGGLGISRGVGDAMSAKPTITLVIIFFSVLVRILEYH